MPATYFDDGRGMYHTRATPAPEKKPYYLPRVGKERAKENRANDQIKANFLHYNPICACGCGEDAECPEHIASGTAGRAASLYDTDLQLPSTLFCNSDAVWHDALIWPKPRKIARKLMLIVEKFNRYSQSRTTLEEVVSWLPIDLARVAQIQRERKE